METFNGIEQTGNGGGLASDITVDASGFSGELSGTDTDLQTALDTLDDIVIETEVDRGAAVSWDFDENDFTDDGAWNSLDLSSIIPAGTKFVRLEFHATATDANANFTFRKNGSSSNNIQQGKTQVANVQNSQQFKIAVDTDRTIEYNLAASTWTILALVSGWII